MNEIVSARKKGVAKKTTRRNRSSASSLVRAARIGFDSPSLSERSMVARLTKTKGLDHVIMANKIKKGLSFKSLTLLVRELDTSQKELSGLLSISASTLRRRKESGRLDADESDRVVRYGRIKDAALLLTDGDDRAALSWLKTPLSVFSNQSPLEYASTEIGARDVENLIGRLRHGVFS